MANISLDLTNIGTIFQSAGFAIMTRVEMDFHDLSDFQMQILLNKSQELFLLSRNMFATAVVQIEQETLTSFQSLEQAKNDINEVIKKIKSIQNIIDLTGKLVTVATQIITLNIPGIISGARAIVTDVQEMLAHTP